MAKTSRLRHFSLNFSALVYCFNLLIRNSRKDKPKLSTEPTGRSQGRGGIAQ